MRVLILAGTAEARALAAALVAQGHEVTSSFAGLTAAPQAAGRVRTGGFGGAAGLAAYLSRAGIGALVDAAHPFAARMAAHAAGAAAAAAVPLLRLERPGWPAEPGWTLVPDLAAAAAALPAGARVFLTTGRQSFPAFAPRSDLWVLARAAGPGPFPFAAGRLVTGLPPFGADAERELLARERIGWLVARDSGGPRGKLDAAAALGVRVVMVMRPAKPPVPTVRTVAEAAAWVAARAGLQAK
jgi:precorrin-6A/cobalt-precorrin-6A reductase